ncbi:MAG: Bug family tripartite tricarboxylate transporter substrate binding protein [Burkholderiales bacterium]
MHISLRSLAQALAAFAAVCFPAAVCAQDYPSRTIRMVLPYPAGAGGTDLVARLVAGKTGEYLGQVIVVENRPGATGIIGTEIVQRAAPDGYTLGFGTPSSHVLSVLSGKAPYDPIKDFTPIVTLTDSVFALVVHPAVPAQNVKELIDYIRKNPRKIAYGSNGMGGTFHLATENFRIAAGGNLEIVHVPYKGTAQVMGDMASGQIQMAFTSVTGAVPFQKQDKLRILAVLEDERYAGLPDVPSIIDTLPNYDKPAGWFIIFGPSGLPQPIVARLNTEMIKAIRSPEVRAKIEAAGLMIVAGTPQQSAARLKRTLDSYGNAKKAGFTFSE